MTPGLWLCLTGLVYALVAFVNLSFKFTELEYIQAVWLLITALPLFVPALARWVKIETVWKTFSRKA